MRAGDDHADARQQPVEPLDHLVVGVDDQYLLPGGDGWIRHFDGLRLTRFARRRSILARRRLKPRHLTVMAMDSLFDRALAAARQLGASDIHLKPGLAPILRINGELRTLHDRDDRR